VKLARGSYRGALDRVVVVVALCVCVCVCVFLFCASLFPSGVILARALTLGNGEVLYGLFCWACAGVAAAAAAGGR